jgi:hypothetical protein
MAKKMTTKYQTKNFYTGNAPINLNWTQAVNIGKFNQRTWHICFFEHLNDEWISIKVFSLETKKSKANFNLSHNGNRFAAGKDYVILQNHYKELEIKIIKVLEEFLSENDNS